METVVVVDTISSITSSTTTNVVVVEPAQRTNMTFLGVVEDEDEAGRRPRRRRRRRGLQAPCLRSSPPCPSLPPTTCSASTTDRATGATGMAVTKWARQGRDRQRLKARQTLTSTCLSSQIGKVQPARALQDTFPTTISLSLSILAAHVVTAADTQSQEARDSRAE